MPQWWAPEGIEDGRSKADQAAFDLMLPSITDLYLTAPVLILLDNTYPGRFWTLMEAWCAMMTATADGVRAAKGSERRFTIACLHNADPKFDTPKLIGFVSDKTPAQMRDILAKPDVAVTNAKDKELFLPVVGQTNEHVKEMMAMAAAP